MQILMGHDYVLILPCPRDGDTQLDPARDGMWECVDDADTQRVCAAPLIRSKTPRPGDDDFFHFLFCSGMLPSQGNKFSKERRPARHRGLITGPGQIARSIKGRGDYFWNVLAPVFRKLIGPFLCGKHRDKSNKGRETERLRKVK